MTVVMRRGLSIAVAFVPMLLAGAPAAAAAGFTFGVAAGDVTSSSAILWTRADRPGPVTLEVLRRPRGGRVLLRRSTTAEPTSDNTVRLKVAGLRAGRTYRYRFRSGADVSDVGRFETAPPPARRRRLRFAISGDADATRAPGASAPSFNNFEVYGRMRSERNDFNVNLGDTIYSDSGVGALPAALTVEEKWAKYRQNLSLPNLSALRRSAGLISGWDDHEFRNDFSVPEFGLPLYEAGRKAFLDYSPAFYSSRYGLYRRFRWGRNLELFLLDERSFRDAKASAGGVCDNPFGPIAADLAPTAPQRIRDAFGFVISPLRKPVAQQCLDRINDPSRTFLGKRQLRRFMRDVRRSRATFKVVLNETPIQQLYALPYDRWEGYSAERTALVRFLRKNVRNVVFLTTDTHANLVNDVRLRTLEPGGPRNTGILEVVTGPVATNTFAREIDEAIGTPGAGNTVGRLFFLPPPPAGLGVRCAALDVYSYAEVEVTSTRLTVTPKDAAGRRVRQLDGSRCGPFRIRRR
jgi:phosphodiesterase/alkaline phosphatase D-like protein